MEEYADSITAILICGAKIQITDSDTMGEFVEALANEYAEEFDELDDDSIDDIFENGNEG